MLLYTASIIKPAALGLGDGESELPLALELAMLVTYYYLQRNARHEQLKSIYLPLAQGLRPQGVQVTWDSRWRRPAVVDPGRGARSRPPAKGRRPEELAALLPAAGARGGGARDPRDERERERERDNR